MTKPIVLSLGELLWDMLPTGKRAGGAPVNFAYHAMKNGAEGYSISAVGEDELGDELLAENPPRQASTPSSNATHGPPPPSKSNCATASGVHHHQKGVAWGPHPLTPVSSSTSCSRPTPSFFGTLGLRSPNPHATITKLLKHAKPEAR